MDHYPILRLWTLHGHIIAVVLAVALFALSLWQAAVHHSIFAAVAGAFVAICAYGVARSYAELVKLVTDMLLPKIEP